MKHSKNFNKNNSNMKKTKLNMILSVYTSDIIRFIEQNSDYDWNESCDIFGSELDYIENNLPDEIKLKVEFVVWKVIVNKLNYDGWIKKFTETQEISQDYLILFTD